MSENKESCDMRRITAPGSHDEWAALDLQRGDFFFYHDPKTGQRRFFCMLPAGHQCVIPIRPLLDPTENGGHSWEWDGNEDAPTLTPSINSVGTWHGFVTAGRMISCQ